MDEKIELIEAEYGIKGFGVVVKLFQEIYGKQGYYIEYTPEVALLFSRKCGLGNDAVSEIINASIRRGIFDKQLYEKYSVLTSPGIQKRYFEAINRRKEITVKKEYILINVAEMGLNVTLCYENVTLSGENADIGTQSKVKKSKVKKSKVIYAEKIAERNFSDAVSEKLNEWVKYKIEKKQPYTETGFNTFLNQTQESIKLYGEKAVIDCFNNSMANNWQGVFYDKCKKIEQPKAGKYGEYY